MLIQFKVKNYLSIKDEAIFSMVAGNGNENMDNMVTVEGIDEKILKSSVLYGPNASGKTNLIRALGSAILMVRQSNIRQIGDKLLDMEPFLFDSDTINKPCEFEFIFITNGKKHIYGFSADRNKVYEEYLYIYYSVKPTKIFERKNVNEYSFIKQDEAKLNLLKTQNTENKLFLSTATTWNYEKTRDAYFWFANNIDTYTGGLDLNNLNIDAYNNDKNDELKKFTLNLLKEADIIIKDFNVEIKEIDDVPPISGANLGLPIPKTRNIKISLFHEIGDKEKKLYEINFFKESSGTQLLFYYAPILKNVFENGYILAIDEIERSLHPKLVEMIIKFFHNPNINKNNAQLIFNTHDTNLLSLDIFRRDQIWFAEKDYTKGTTEIYALDDFSVRKTENIQKGYLNGRFGAIPFVANGDNLWQN